uniref:RHS repeat-associated core domain-containing protein n=1 Tax=Parastrongyloides trichosuri TaxID=131310 RepID=A0A0N4ZEC0_PARTI
MDFNFRQYDPQLGRFLSIDPLADDMSQSHLSPYAAMANRPHQAIDPNSLKGYNFSAPFGQYMPLFPDEYSMRRQLKANAERDAFLYGTPLPRVVGEVYNPFSNLNSSYGGGNPFASSIGGAGGGSSGGAGGGGTGGSNPPNLYFKIDGRFFIAYYDKDNNFNFSETPFSEDFVFVGQRMQKQQNGGDPNSVDPSTLGRNLFGSHYIGPWNPKTYGGEWDYSVAPKNAADRNGLIHDRAYDDLGIEGASGLFLSKQAIPADKRFVSNQMSIMMNAWYPMDVRFQAGVSGFILGGAATPKITVYGTQDAVKEVGYTWHYGGDSTTTDEWIQQANADSVSFNFYFPDENIVMWCSFFARADAWYAPSCTMALIGYVKPNETKWKFNADISSKEKREITDKLESLILNKISDELKKN